MRLFQVDTVLCLNKNIHTPIFDGSHHFKMLQTIHTNNRRSNNEKKYHKTLKNLIPRKTYTNINKIELTYSSMTT